MRKSKYYDLHQALNSKEIEKIIDEIGKENLFPEEWAVISCSRKITEKQIEKWSKYLDWEAIPLFYNLSLNFIEKNLKKINQYTFAKFQKVPFSFIQKNKNILYLPGFLFNEKIPSNEKNKIKTLISFMEKEKKKYWKELEEKSFFRKKINNKKEIISFEKLSKTTKENKVLKTIKKERKNIKKEKAIFKKTKDYLGLKKNELKNILLKRNVKVFYHDTIDILIKKCKESE